MTIYPLDFHRRCEQKWARRADVSKAAERPPRSRLTAGAANPGRGGKARVIAPAVNRAR